MLTGSRFLVLARDVSSFSGTLLRGRWSVGCSHHLSQQAASWGQPGAGFDPALEVELSVLGHSPGVCWESPVPRMRSCDQESLWKDVKGFRENNNRIFMVSASDSVPKKQFFQFFPWLLFDYLLFFVSCLLLVVFPGSSQESCRTRISFQCLRTPTCWTRKFT